MSVSARADWRIWAGFALMCVALFMSVLDVQIVLTALPTIRASLHVGEDAMSWVQTSYLTAEVIAIPLSGLLTRALGLRGCLVRAVAGFTLASLGCALSTSFAMLIVTRTIQGLFGGVIIPCVFSAVFLLFSPEDEPVATGLAGVMAMLAPTLGPWLGGWLTVRFGWPALFTINLLPGLVAAVGMARWVPAGDRDPTLLATIDRIGLMMLAMAMTGIEIALKLAPERGWTSQATLVPLAGGTLLLAGFVRRCARVPHALVEPAVLADRRMVAATIANAVFGATLYASTYLMVVFLGLVRGHDALAIGSVLMVTGAAQLVSAPLAVWGERRLAVLPYCLAGFALFAAGCAIDARLTPDSDFAALVWPQVLRGAALMLCILGTTRLALGHLPAGAVANASGLFNLARNLGGAVGIAVIDSLLQSVIHARADAIVAALRAGDVTTAGALHLPIDDFLAMHDAPIDADMRALLEPLVRHLALSDAVNRAWIVLAAAAAAVALCTALAWVSGLGKTMVQAPESYH